MLAGRLRERITLQRPAAGGDVDEFNDPVAGWVDVAVDRRAAKQDVSDGERDRAAQEGAVRTARFQIRASSDVAALGATWRLIHKGKVFDITGRKDVLSESGAVDGYEITAAAQADTP